MDNPVSYFNVWGRGWSTALAKGCLEALEGSSGGTTDDDDGNLLPTKDLIQKRSLLPTLQLNTNSY